MGKKLKERIEKFEEILNKEIKDLTINKQTKKGYIFSRIVIVYPGYKLESPEEYLKNTDIWSSSPEIFDSVGCTDFLAFRRNI